MKYKESQIVLLNDGRTVYIISVDYSDKKYVVSDTDNQIDCFCIKESEVFSLVVQA